MNSREKTLAGLIVGIGVIGVTYYGWTKVDAMFQSREDTLSKIEAEIRGYDLTMHKDRKMAKAMKALKVRSLPPNDTDQRLYDRWLAKIAAESGVEINDKKDPVRARRTAGNAYVPYTFGVRGVTTAEGLTTFLHKLYSSNDLHKVKTWRVKPAADSKSKLNVDLTVEAIALPGAPDRKEVGNLASDELQGRKLDEFIASVVQRNLFAPANQSPVMKALGKETVEKGRSLRFDVAKKTSDPDKDDTISYAVVDAPEGVKINEKTGSLRWSTKKDADDGEYTIVVSATDSGFPAKTVTEKLTVELKDPPPKVVKAKAPEFDEAKHAYVSGIVMKDGEKQLWIHVRTSGKIIKLFEGDEVNVGTVAGTLKSIGFKSVEIETENGPVLIKAGKTLSSAIQLEDRIGRLP